ncbi:leucine-rich repeat-containing protein 14-like [Branchiostoma floridae]|uniref:Leucine-rich repeat-containing protein 14-like n=1 Tax=Branchiostoma floridae TaxID=7739 RepID=A0A9J7L3F1_BRAFL|nr:leucine-rich repeat-containing protein 14-like [Branchiostoma floridae]
MADRRPFDAKDFQVKNSAVFGLVLESSTAFTPAPDCRGGKETYSTLLELSVAALAKYQSLMQTAVKTVPRVLLIKLLKEALLRSHHLCIRDLISNWPERSLDFSEILGSQHRHRVQDLLNWESGRAKIIAHSLLNCQSGALQVVDLREALPNREATVSFVEASLQSHRQQRTKDLHVYLNMWTEDCLMEEGKVAKSLSPEERGIKLHPFRVVTVSLGSTLERLGRRLEPQVLTGLELKSDTFETADSFATLLGGGKFPNLSALSLPNFAKPLEPADFQVLGEVLSHLPALRRLNLNGLRVMGQLRQLLQNMPGHLEHLNVSHCRLVSIDVLFLYESRHADTLRELSICGMSRFNHLCLLVRGVAPQIEWLDLSGCPECFEEDFLSRMRFILRSPFSKLRFLNFTGNLISNFNPAISVCLFFAGSDRIRSLATLHLDAMHLNESFAELARAKLGNVNGKNRPKKVQAQYDPDTGLTVLKVLWMDTAM